MSYKGDVAVLQLAAGAIAGNVPIDQMVQELLRLSGGTFKNPATNYYQIEQDTLKITENVAQVFMGMRIQCAQCHNHPFDRWTMDDYYSFAAFFAQIGRKQGDDPRETIVFNSRRRRSEAPGGRAGDAAEVPRRRDARRRQGNDRREVLAEWLASPENPYFATQPGQHRVGPLLRPRHRRRSRRRPRQQSAGEPRTARRAWASDFTEYKYDFKTAGARHLHVAHVSAFSRKRTKPTPATSATSRTAWSAAFGPKCCSTASRR